MCILKEPNYIVEIANERMVKLWGTTAEAVLHKPIFEGLSQAKGQGLEELLLNVYTTGKTFSAFGLPVSLPRNGTLQTVYVNFVYEAYRDAGGTISGIMVVASDVQNRF